MFYKMIQTKRNEWYASQECTVVSLIDYMQKTGYLRDAQIDAIKTYLYLKIACGCKPLAQLFTAGQFNNLKRRVRFPYPAPKIERVCLGRLSLFLERWESKRILILCERSEQTKSAANN